MIANYLNVIKAEQLMVGKHLLISNNKPIWDTNDPSMRSLIDKVNRLLSLLSSIRVTVFSIVFFSTRSQRARGCNYGYARLSQNKETSACKLFIGFDTMFWPIFVDFENEAVSLCINNLNNKG